MLEETNQFSIAKHYFSVNREKSIEIRNRLTEFGSSNIIRATGILIRAGNPVEVVFGVGPLTGSMVEQGTR